MKPVEFEGQTNLLAPPDGWNDDHPDKKCGALPFIREQIEGYNVTSSYWKPTQAEIDELMNGGYVRLTVIGNAHPICSVSTGQIKELP